MKSKRLFKLIISALITTLITLSGFIGYKHYTNQRYISTVKAQQIQQLETNKEAENWKYKLEQFKNSYSKEQKLLVLEGTVNIENTITSEDDIVKYQGNDNTIKFLANKLNDLKTKNMTVNTTYKYGFTYNIKDYMKVSSNNGELVIEINKQFLNLQYLDEQTDKTTIKVEKHLLSGEFTYQQQQAIMNLTKIKTYNTLISDSDIMDKSIEGTKDIIISMAKKFGFDKVDVRIIDSPDMVSKDEVKINNVTYSK